MKRVLSLLFLAFLSLCSCMSGERNLSSVKDQTCTEDSAFRGKFWNYYSRAVSCAEGGFYEEAINDFKQAIQKRERDQWRARTYGMHFISYFPHRELGIVYYKIKRYDEAIKELETSLNHTESAKAKFFLNKVHRDFIAKRKPDHRQPLIEIKSPLSGTLTNKFQIPLSIIIEDDHFVSFASINNNPVILELARKVVAVEEDIQIEQGTNIIEVVAKNLAGNTSKQSVKIDLDIDGPIISIVDERVSGRKAVLKGFISDPSGLAYVSINGQISNTNGATRIPFRHEIALAGRNSTVLIEAQDVVGNETVGEFSAASMQSSNVSGKAFKNQESSQVEHQGKWRFVLVSSTEVDSKPPLVALEGISHYEVTYGEHIVIAFRIIDDSKIVSAKLNGRELTDEPVKQIAYSAGRKLRVGENRFILEATDSLGYIAKKRFIVDRKIPKIRQTSERLYMAVQRPFERVNVTSSAVVLADKFFVQSLLKQKRFQVAEANEVSANYDLILNGTVYEDKDGITVLVEIKDGSTEMIVSSQDIFGKNNDLTAIKNLVEQLAGKIRKEFPLVEGKVTSTRSILFCRIA